MISRFVAIGDFHATPDARNADRWIAMRQIVRETLALEYLAAVLWPGDLFDKASTVEDRNRIDATLLELAEHAPVVIVYGNHDLPGDLDGFANLRGRWPITVVSQHGCLTIDLATGARATIFALPYVHKAHLLGAGVAGADVVETATDLFEPIFMGVADELQSARLRGELTLMIGHINVSGSIASTGQPNRGREIELHPRHLDRLGVIPKILNHIHKPQEIGGAHYVGSVVRNDYGEREDKSYLVATCSTLGVAHSWMIERKPIDTPPMLHIEGRLTRDGFMPVGDELMCPACHGDGDGRHVVNEGTVSCEACSGSGRRSFVGADVRVRYTYAASERDVLDHGAVGKLFAQALRLKVEGFAESDRELREPEVVRETSLEGKLSALWKRPLTAAESRKLQLLARGEEGMADVLAAVERDLQDYERVGAQRAPSSTDAAVTA